MLYQQLLHPICLVLLLRSFQQDSTCSGSSGEVIEVPKAIKVAKRFIRKHPRIVVETAAGGAVGAAVAKRSSGENPNSGPNHGKSMHGNKLE